MKNIIESQMTISELIDYVNITEPEVLLEAGWHSYSSQPKIKMIEQPTVYGREATTCSIIDERTSALLGNIREVVAVIPKPSQYLGALVNEKNTIIHLPGKSKYIVYSWDNKGNLIDFKSGLKDRLVAVGGRIPFTIISESIKNPPLLFFFIVKPRYDWLKVNPAMDSNNHNSEYFIFSRNV